MASNLTIDVGGVLIAGRRITLEDVVEIPAFGAFSFPEPAHVSLDIRRVERGLQIDGSIDAIVTGPCDRCLEDVTIPVNVVVEERFDPPAGTADPFGEHNVLSGEDLDAGDLVRQLVTTALPMGFVCSDGCLGLCPQCGHNRNEEPCDCSEIEEIG